MKKKFTLEISNPCSEDFNKMIPNSNGSFCDSCMKNVIDLSKKTNSEVAKFITENRDKNICARLKTSQLEEEFVYNETSKIDNFKYAALAASVLLVSNLSAQEKVPVNTEIVSAKPDVYKVGKVAYHSSDNQQVSVVINGKLLEAKTNKPLNKDLFSNLILSINDSGETVNVNPKTGEFTLTANVRENSNSVMVTIKSNDYYLHKEIRLDIKSVRNNILIQNIIIDTDEFVQLKTMVLGGLGINYSKK